MTTTLLAYIPSPAQGVWHLGPVPIRAYALCIITGIVAALIIGDRRWVARGGQPGVIYDIALWAVPFGLVGGRLYHVMTDWRTYFAEGGAGVMGALKVWDGGLGIWGAVALGAVGAWIGCRRHGIPLPAFGDAVAPGVVLAQGIGRLGNYFNQELYGRPTNVPWGLEIFERADSQGRVSPHLLDGVSTGQVAAVVHPTFLYELIWNVLVFVFLLWADRRFRLGHGRLFALYVASYCIGRFCVELMRSDPATLIAGIRVNSFTSTFVFVGAVVYMMVAPKGREDPSTLAGRAEDEADEADEADEVSGAHSDDKELAAVGAAAAAAAVGVAAGDGDGEPETVDDGGASDAEDVEPAVPVDVEQGESASDAPDDSDIADEADAVETQSDETEVLADDDASDQGAEPEDSVEESETTESEVVDASAESDEADDKAADDTDGDAESAEPVEATESGGVPESEPDQPEPAGDSVADADGEASEVVDASAESDEAADEAAAKADDEAAAVEPTSEPESDAEPAEDGADATAADGLVEAAGDSDSEPEVKAAPTTAVLPVWEPPVSRRRWFRRQR